MPAQRALAAPDSLKGVMAAADAAEALVAGFAEGGAECEALPIADGGEGSAAVLASVFGGDWRRATVADPLGRPVEARYLVLPDGTAIVEAAEAIGLPLLAPHERDPMSGSSAGLGELLLAVLADRPASVLVCLGGTATVDGGRGLRRVLGARLRDMPVRVACDVDNPLLGERGAARAFGPQKGAAPDQVVELERRLAADEELAPFADRRGAGAAGGLGAALAALGAELLPGAELILDLLRFRERVRGAALVVTGEGTVDATTTEGKGPGAVLRICREEGVDCVLFGGRVVLAPAGAEVRALSGRRERAREDLVELGAELAGRLL